MPHAIQMLSQKGSLFLTRPFLFHYIERRDALEACANQLFEVVTSGKVRINVNQRFALKDAAGRPTRHWKRAQPRAPRS